MSLSVYFVLLFQSLIASGTHIVAKVVIHDIEPITLTLLRSVIAAVALLILVLIKRTGMLFERKDVLTIIVLSILAIPVNQFLFLTAMKYTSPAHAALLYGTTPALVLLLSWISGAEAPSWKRITGVLIAFLGVVLIVFEKGIDFHSEYMKGNLLLVVAVIAWAMYTVQGKPLIMKYGAFRVSSASMIIGALLFLPFGWSNAKAFDYASLSSTHWGEVLYLSIGTSIFAYYLWYYALGKLDASKVSVFANLQPVLTVALAIVLLGQTISGTFIVGGMITLSGVIMVQLT